MKCILWTGAYNEAIVSDKLVFILVFCGFKINSIKFLTIKWEWLRINIDNIYGLNPPDDGHSLPTIEIMFKFS